MTEQTFYVFMVIMAFAFFGVWALNNVGIGKHKRAYNHVPFRKRTKR